jgi:hypothetical protein
MNRKHMIMNKNIRKSLLTILCFFFLGGYLFLPLSGWGGEIITSTEKWKKLIETSTHQGVLSQDLEQILAVVRQAHTAGFPIEPFLNKALEGMAKHVSPSIIQRVLKERLANFHTCQKVLEQLPDSDKKSVSQSQQALAILAESMARGISRDDLEELGGYAPSPKPLHLANASEDFVTLKDLGFSPKDAKEIVIQILQSGGYYQRNREVVQTVRLGRKKKIPLPELKDQLLRTFRRGRETQRLSPMRLNHDQNQKTFKQHLPQGQTNSPKGKGSSHRLQ